MPNTKNCILSFSNQKGRYVQNMARLSDSLRDNFDGDFLAFIGEETLGCPKHADDPYSFKIYAFRKAQEAGYKNVLWLDSSVFAVNKVQKIFDDIEAIGFAYQIAGHWAGNWSTQECLDYHEITRDEAMLMPCIGNAGLLGLSFEKHHPNMFFNEWEKSQQAGMFKGPWDNKDGALGTDERIFGHRHDLTNSSIIINKMGLIQYAYPGDEVLMYGGIYDGIINSTILMKAQG